MTKDIMGDDHVSGKHVHAKDFDELEEGDQKRYSKKSSKYKRVDGQEKISKDHHGKYIDDYEDKYHKTKHDIIDTLDTHTRSKKYYNKGDDMSDFSNFRSRKSFKDYDDDYDFHGKHLSEEEWTLKEKKEHENLSELISKEKELESAAGDVKAAQTSLSDEKKKIDEEINGKIRETEQLRKDFERKAAARAEAERRSAELREKAELEDRLADKKKRTEQLMQTSSIEQKAYELHEKESELKKQKSLVKDALEEVDDEIHRVTHSMESSQKSRYIADKRRREIQFRSMYHRQRDHHRRELEREKEQRMSYEKE